MVWYLIAKLLYRFEGFKDALEKVLDVRLDAATKKRQVKQ